jgi:hypothetical protein
VRSRAGFNTFRAPHALLVAVMNNWSFGGAQGIGDVAEGIPGFSGGRRFKSWGFCRTTFCAMSWLPRCSLRSVFNDGETCALPVPEVSLVQEFPGQKVRSTGSSISG